MHQIVGTFENRSALEAAGHLFGAAGYTAETLTLLVPPETGRRVVPLTQRGELMLRAAVRWGIIGALIVEVPSVIAMLLLPVTRTVGPTVEIVSIFPPSRCRARCTSHAPSTALVE